jgi:hypothetical protein
MIEDQNAENKIVKASSEHLSGAASAEVKPSYSLWTFIALFYVIILLLMVLIPAIAGTLFWVVLFGGVVVGITFLVTVMKIGAGRGHIEWFAYLILGVVGGIILFFISAFSALVGYVHGHPINGD